jgi:nicotinamide N-methyltransferase
VVLTDYPDKALLDNLAYNVDQNVHPPRRDAVRVLGCVWGSSVDPVLAALLRQQDTATESDADAAAGPDTSKFDLILLSDLIFNHSQVRQLEPSLSMASSSFHHFAISSPTLFIMNE